MRPGYRQASLVHALIESVEGQNKVQQSAALVHNRYSTNEHSSWSPESMVGVQDAYQRIRRDYGHLGKKLNPSLFDARKLPRPVMCWIRTQEPGR